MLKQNCGREAEEEDHGANSSSAPDEAPPAGFTVPARSKKGGRSSKADLRKQEVPEPAPPIFEAAPPADPSTHTVPILEISRTADESITLALPVGTAADRPMALLHSNDLQNWVPVHASLEASIALPTNYRQGYYRLAPQP